MRGNDVFVKLNVKNIGEVRSLIIDKDMDNDTCGNKYIMCAGKYDKSGWTVVFKAKNYKEAQDIIEKTSLKNKITEVVEKFPTLHPVFC